MKFGDDLDIGIKEYLGRLGPGVTIILTIIYKGVLYEGIYWYTNVFTIIQVPDELEDVMGCDIEEHIEYDNIIEYLHEESLNYGDIVPNLDDIYGGSNPSGEN